MKNASWSNKESCTISEKRYNFLLGRMYFTGDDGYQSILVFAQCLVH